jgi:ferredoxin-type protein NapH
MIFSRIRWVVMIVSFIILTFGVYLFGAKVTAVKIPTFACPFNHEGLIDGSCYELCHLPEFVKNDWAAGKIGLVLGFFVVNFLFIVVLGRFLCGFICPFGLIQDLLDRLRQWLRIDSLRFNEKHYQWICLIKWELLVIFLVINFLGISFCDFCPILGITPPLAGRVGALTMSGTIAVLMVAGSFLKRRFWCNICPLGLLIGLFYPISLFRLHKDCQACTECGACYEACPMGIKSIYTERVKTDITTYDCLICGECINKCPENNALKLVFHKYPFYIASRANFFKTQGVKPQNDDHRKIGKLLKRERTTDGSKESPV